MSIESIIKQQVGKAIEVLYNQSVTEKSITIQATRKDVRGDMTIVVFPFLRLSKKSPEQTATEIGEYLKNNISEVSDFSVIKGFLNIEIAQQYWLDFLNKVANETTFGFSEPDSVDKTIMIEYSSPNTNKPLHLGHIRNNLLGWSVAEILKANGYKVVKVNLVNDRGIHICKSMLAW